MALSDGRAAGLLDPQRRVGLLHPGGRVEQRADPVLRGRRGRRSW